MSRLSFEYALAHLLLTVYRLIPAIPAVSLAPKCYSTGFQNIYGQLAVANHSKNCWWLFCLIYPSAFPNHAIKFGSHVTYAKIIYCSAVISVYIRCDQSMSLAGNNFRASFLSQGRQGFSDNGNKQKQQSSCCDRRYWFGGKSRTSH